jgi:mRNA interferase MazF
VKRGDIFTFSMRGAAAKPRPGIVVQADEFMIVGRPVLVCPLTSDLSDATFFRVDIIPSEDNGLRTHSQAMLDRLSAALPNEVGDRVGRLSAADLSRVEFALVNILGLGSAAAILSGKGTSS